MGLLSLVLEGFVVVAESNGLTDFVSASYATGFVLESGSQLPVQLDMLELTGQRIEEDWQ